MLTRGPGFTEDQGRVPFENVYAHLLRYNLIPECPLLGGTEGSYPFIGTDHVISKTRGEKKSIYR